MLILKTVQIKNNFYQQNTRLKTILNLSFIISGSETVRKQKKKTILNFQYIHNRLLSLNLIEESVKKNN